MSWPLEQRIPRYDLALSGLLLLILLLTYAGLARTVFPESRRAIESLQVADSARTVGRELPLHRARGRLRRQARQNRQAYGRLAAELWPAAVTETVADTIKRRAEAERLLRRLPPTVRRGLADLGASPERLLLLRTLLDAMARAEADPRKIRQLILPPEQRQDLQGALLERVTKHTLALQLALPADKLPRLLAELARTRRPRLFVQRMSLACSEKQDCELTLQITAVSLGLADRVRLPAAEHDEDTGWQTIGPSVRRDW